MHARMSRHVRVGALITTGLAVSLALSGCAGESPSGEAENTINVQFIGPPLFGMNPAKTGGGSSILYASAAYDPLIFMEPDGTFSPALATEWEYVGEGNTAMRLTIREGVEFSDGEPLNAEAVKRSLEYTRDGNFYPSVQLASFESIEATDDYTVDITFSKPVPNAPTILSQNGVGFIISPAALDTPDILDTETAGAGAYVLDPDATVVNSSYVFVRNENYWNPDAIKTDRLVIQAINDPNTVLSSIQTGQIDIALGNVQTADAAASAGLEIYPVGGAVHMLTLFDREGTIVPALGDERVRQAVNFAIDREGIAQAVVGEYGMPTTQIAFPDTAGYSAEVGELYSYDPERAQELLAEAGFAEGFEFSITCSTMIGSCPLAEAIASDLGKVGIIATIDEVTGEVQGFDEKLRSGTVPAAMQTASRDMERVVNFAGLPSETPVSNNPFQSSDPEVTALYDQAVRTSDPEEQAELWTEANARLMELAWFAPVFVRQDLYYTTSQIEGFEVSNANPVYTPINPFDGSSSWSKVG